MTMTELLRDYSSQPQLMRLSFPTTEWRSTLGFEARDVPANALGLMGQVLITRLPAPGVTRKKADQFKKKTVSYALVYRDFGPEGAARATAETPPMLGPLQSVPDCPHSHLVLELNVLAYLLKLPADVHLGCYVHITGQTPELLTVSRVADLTQQLLNDAYVVRKRMVGERPSKEGEASQRAAAIAAGATTLYAGTSDAQGSGDSISGSSRTGEPGPADGHAACGAAPGRATPLHQVGVRLQQQSLFDLQESAG